MPVEVIAEYIGNNQVRLSWESMNEPHIHGWRVSRNGTDVSGTGPWQSAVMGPDTRSFTFNDLLPDTEYTFNLIGVYASFSRNVRTSVGSTPTQPDIPQQPSPTNTAAQRHNWGAPHSSSDTFNYKGLPDPKKWSVYGMGGSTGGSGSNCWPGHDGNGRRCVYTNTVNGEYLRQTGFANGDSAGISHKHDQKYGRWEVRARILGSGKTGKPYHPVLITWPQSNQWPAGAEYDFLEVNVGDKGAAAFLHFPNHKPRRQEHATKANVDLTQWHNYGFEWAPTHLAGFIDGERWFHFDKDGIQNAPGPMHLTIQLDNFFKGQQMSEGYFDIAWAMVYPYRA